MIEAKNRRLASIIDSLAPDSPYFRMLGHIAGRYSDITVDSDLERAISQEKMNKGEVFRQLTADQGKGPAHCSGKEEGATKPATSSRRDAIRSRNKTRRAFISRESSRR